MLLIAEYALKIKVHELYTSASQAQLSLPVAIIITILGLATIKISRQQEF